MVVVKPGPLYAVIGDYAFLAEQIDNRREELQIGVDDLDQRADLAEHFASKACGPSQSAKWGLATPSGKANGAGKPGTLFRVLEALGLRLALIEDDKLTKLAREGGIRHTNHVRTGNYGRRAAIRVFKRVQRELASRGAQALNAKLTPEQRAANGRKGALIRWGDVKAAASTPISAQSASESAPCAPTNNPAVAGSKRRARPMSPCPTA